MRSTGDKFANESIPGLRCSCHTSQFASERKRYFAVKYLSLKQTKGFPITSGVAKDGDVRGGILWSHPS